MMMDNFAEVCRKLAFPCIGFDICKTVDWGAFDCCKRD